MKTEDYFLKTWQRICPSCIEPIYPGACAIIARTPTGIPPLEERPKDLARYWSIMNPKPLTGPEFTSHLASRQCYKCGYLLPYNIETSRSLNIAIVGDNRTGKSHYIAALLQQINGNLLPAEQGISFSCLTPDVRKRYEQEYFQPMFDKKQSFGRTARANSEQHSPLIYQLSVRTSPRVPATNANLIIYDTAGEDYNDSESLVTYARYVLTADALIFIADPGATFSTGFQKHIPSNIKYEGPGQTSTESLNAVIRLLERFRGQDTGSSLYDIPIAITLSKSDLFIYMKSIDNQEIFKNTNYAEGINLNDIHEIDKEVRMLIKDNGGTSLLHACQAFAKKSFFAISATGYSPDIDGKFPAIEPRRCLDPLFWILHQLQIVGTD